MNRKLLYISILSLSFCFSHCSKYLDKKSDSTLATLNNVQDMQSFIDYYQVMNNQIPITLEVATDNYYVLTKDLLGLLDQIQATYQWGKTNNSFITYAWPYQPIFYSNIILDQIHDIEKSNIELWNNVKGSALFFRSYYLFMIAQIYAKPYNANTANADLGVPVRVSSDFNEKTTRPTNEETYKAILNDLNESILLLPNLPLQGIKTRPSKAASYGLLAKVYLSMRKYDSAGVYANKCLEINSQLLNLNDITTDFSGVTANAPFKRFNREIIFYARSTQPEILSPSRAKIDSNLINSYSDNDLRKTAYFRKNTGNNIGTYAFKGDYDGSGSSSGYVFAGIVTDEMYLIRAETYARVGKITEAMADLNTLMRTRWNKDVPYSEFTAANTEEATNLVLTERRKELLFRGTRWTDMRRLMSEGRILPVPSRVISDQTFTLKADQVFQLPYDVIKLTGMPQNP